MSNEIVKAGEGALTFNGKRPKATDDEVFMALGPMFVAFPNVKLAPETLNLYIRMLRDIDPEVLVHAVEAAVAVCKFMPTIADIREQVEKKDQIPPGQRPSLDPRDIPPVPTKFYRLDPVEDERQRKARLKETLKWDKYYL